MSTARKAANTAAYVKALMDEPLIDPKKVEWLRALSDEEKHVYNETLDTQMNVHLAKVGVPVQLQPSVKAEWVRRLSRDRKVHQ